MPKLISHVIGLIEIDAPATMTDALDAPEPQAAESETQSARILRFDAGEQPGAAPRILRFQPTRVERRRADLNRLCQELELELIRVRRLMATIKRMTRE
jgi:hypothetical protein